MEQVIEVLVKKKVTVKDIAGIVFLCTAIIAIDLFCFAFISIAVMLMPLILIASGFAIYYIIKYSQIEFEYILVNDELDIDKIMGKIKRKKVIAVKKSNIISFDKVTSNDYQRYKKQTNKLIRAASDQYSQENYYIALSDNTKTLIILDRNDSIYRALRKR